MPADPWRGELAQNFQSFRQGDLKGPNGIVIRSTKGIDNPRQLLARDIRELRRVYYDIPNSTLKELIKLNKKMYPEMRK